MENLTVRMHAEKFWLWNIKKTWIVESEGIFSKPYATNTICPVITFDLWLEKKNLKSLEFDTHKEANDFISRYSDNYHILKSPNWLVEKNGLDQFRLKQKDMRYNTIIDVDEDYLLPVNDVIFKGEVEKCMFIFDHTYTMKYNLFDETFPSLRSVRDFIESYKKKTTWERHASFN